MAKGKAPTKISDCSLVREIYSKKGIKFNNKLQTPVKFSNFFIFITSNAGQLHYSVSFDLLEK